jgi:hypothetical protein
MGENPFAPPATRDLDGTASSATTGAVVSEEAMRELVEGGVWARRLAWLMIASIVLALVSVALPLVRGADAYAVGTAVGGVVIGAGISGVFFVVFRRYAAAAKRLAGGEREAAFQVIDAQAAYFKLSALLVFAAVGLGILAFVGVMVWARVKGVP